MKVCMNASLTDIGNAAMTPTGWLVGAGIFETLRTVNGLAYAYARHIERAVKSAAIAKVVLPPLDVVASSVADLLAAEALADGLLRISFDKNGQWAAVHLPYQPVTTAAKVRIHPDALMSKGERIKSYPYENRLAILDEAKLLGFDEAIVCSTEGNLCEGAVSNIVFLIDGRWVTPPTSDGVLPGIMRGLVIDYCGVSVQSVRLSQIEEISAAILLSSLRIAQSIQSIDGRELELSQAFNDEIHAMAVLHSVG
ncbi:MAG: hypothetical protein EXQ76_00775 [Candidatus Planktophila sp.]|nr:hypothetical protein [Candidatus Planktophila sp.]